VRLGITLVAAFAAVALAGCAGGDDDETAAPLPVAQRFVSAEDAPGTKPDPVEEGQTTTDLDEFIGAAGEILIDPDEGEMSTLFEDAGFKQAGADVRFFGETHSRTAPHVVSTFTEVASEDGAASGLDFYETDTKKPCPMSCATKISTFDVDDIDGARGVHRIATAEDVERLGNEDEQPFESYWIGFTDGDVVYTMDLHGRPGSVTEEQAQDIARAYYDRLTGS
jgi:hypothetical protein